jgi:hypothetical protein
LDQGTLIREKVITTTRGLGLKAMDPGKEDINDRIASVEKAKAAQAAATSR